MTVASAAAGERRSTVGLRACSDRARRVLSAARVCFARHGFHGASMASIAEEAGISVGHIYRYFENKEAVVAAIIEQDLEEAAETLARVDGDSDQMATRLLERLQTEGKALGTPLRLEILAEAARSPKVAAMMRKRDERIRIHLRGVLVRSCRATPCHASEQAANARVELICALMEGFSLRLLKGGASPDAALLSEMESALSRALSIPLINEHSI